MTSIILDDIDHSFAANKLAPLPVTALSETLLVPLHGHHVVKQSKDSRNYPATPITPSNQNFAEIRAQLSVLADRALSRRLQTQVLAPYASVFKGRADSGPLSASNSRSNEAGKGNKEHFELHVSTYIEYCIILEGDNFS
jgi:hypothetical protein